MTLRLGQFRKWVGIRGLFVLWVRLLDRNITDQLSLGLSVCVCVCMGYMLVYNPKHETYMDEMLKTTR